MCLISKQKELEIADNDIECYKLVLVDSKGNYMTPYTGTELENDVINGSKPFEPNEQIPTPVTSDLHTSYLWAKGLIHAYKDYDSCYNQAVFIDSCYAAELLLYNSVMPTYIKDTPKKSCAIYKCIIPKGVRYVEGTDDIAAVKMQFIKRIS